MIRRNGGSHRRTTLTSAMLLSSVKRRRRFLRRLSVMTILIITIIVLHTKDKILQGSIHLESSSSCVRNSTVGEILQQSVEENLHQAANNILPNVTEEEKSGSQAKNRSTTAQLANDKALIATAYHTPPSISFEHPQSSINIQSNNKVPYHEKRQTIIMVTYVFGEEAINKRYLRLFIESARRSGIDMIAIVGPTAPEYPLPPNVQHFPITWDELTDRVRDRIFGGKEPGTLRQAQNFYKVIDFKPLFAHLFPELIENYDFWGHIDNDMVLGNVRKFLNRVKLTKYDLIASFPNEYTSGPFMVYRNTPAINELFRFSKRPLEEIFATHETRVFDEWGGGTKSVRTATSNVDEYDDSYASTMAGIVDLNHERLGLRWFGGIMSVWDGFCRKRLEGMCTQCKLVIASGRHGQTLYEEYRGRDGTIKQRKVAFCHFEFSKETMETSLSNDSWKQHPIGDEWLGQGEYRINFLEGLIPANESL